jgi:hypothetical protein
MRTKRSLAERQLSKPRYVSATGLTRSLISEHNKNKLLIPFGSGPSQFWVKINTLSLRLEKPRGFRTKGPLIRVPDRNETATGPHAVSFTSIYPSCAGQRWTASCDRTL